MVDLINKILQNNKDWAAELINEDPDYFNRLSEGQSPDILWIGCSDSRVPPDRITKMDPGSMFVHRNIANLVVQTDMNMLSVLQYAVDVLAVKHIIVCGHYGCGGVRAAMTNDDHGLIDNWLRTIKDTQNYYWAQLEHLSKEDRERRLIELNVIEQVYNLGKTNTILQKWRGANFPYLHGWVFDLKTGIIKTQSSMINSEVTLKEVCKFENKIIGHS